MVKVQQHSHSRIPHVSICEELLNPGIKIVNGEMGLVNVSEKLTDKTKNLLTKLAINNKIASNSLKQDVHD